ncbi:MAG: DUF3047 domain-containing protein [Balneolaceae bacterium]|nr:DUF3047 domain-containing protein [Balneolaceae bacterium]
MTKFYFLLFIWLIRIVSGQNSTERILFSVSKYNKTTEKNGGGKAVWEEMEVKADNLTEYQLITLADSTHVIKATSNNAASGLIHTADIDTEQYPVIKWRWKIEQVLEKGNLEKKRGDDYAARIYVTFDYDRSKLSLGEKIKLWAIETFTSYEIPLRAINYIWANKAPAGTVAPNPFTDWVQMIAVQSGNEKAGEWISERRNIYKDYKKAFGEEPGNITGVAIMTDSDNTGGSATGYYGDIVFEKQ